MLICAPLQVEIVPLAARIKPVSATVVAWQD